MTRWSSRSVKQEGRGSEPIRGSVSDVKTPVWVLLLVLCCFFVVFFGFFLALLAGEETPASGPTAQVPAAGQGALMAITAQSVEHTLTYPRVPGATKTSQEIKVPDTVKSPNFFPFPIGFWRV
jgi:heme/copper-type cytochrome/quinol oxidase subunit 3